LEKKGNDKSPYFVSSFFTIKHRYMKSNIKLVSTRDMDRDTWLRYRLNGIGASEVGVIFGLSPYKASIQLFYEKIGEHPRFDMQSLPAFLGKNQESFIADMWEHWGGDQDSMMRNYDTDNRIRRCKRVNAYAHNDKYPWLFVSLDREINQYDSRGNGTLELKTIGGYEADKWESGLPPIYVMQVQTQMLVCEYFFGEIAILKDNRDFMVLPFEFSESITASIIEKTGEFWGKVVEARKIMTQRFEADRNFNGRMVDELTAQLQSLEPSPDGSDAFNNFLKEKYQIALPGERAGTLVELEAAKAHKDIQGRIKELKEAETLQTNILKNSIGQQDCDKLDFGKNGFVSWKADSNGVRRFLNKVK
jgi:putative phage-type endonuclease